MAKIEKDDETVAPPTARVMVEDPMDTIKMQGGIHSPTNADGPALNFQTRLKHFN